MKKCPFCGEEIKEELQICPHCNERIFGNNQEYGNLYNKSQPNLERLKGDQNQTNQDKQFNLSSKEITNIIFGTVAIIFAITILFNVFSDPLDELTSGCSKDGDEFNGETYYCKNKEWEVVHKSMSNTPPHYNYSVQAKKHQDTIAHIYWKEGEYQCLIAAWTPRQYRGPCSEEEFIEKLKNEIKELKLRQKI